MKPKQVNIVCRLALTLALGCSTGYSQDNPSATNAPPSAESDSSAANTVVELIEFHDTALTELIQTLARQASLNYIIDPKVPYGQIGPDGKTPTPQPVISVRWEKVTAQEALTALLNNYSLTLVEDTKTKISRITVRDPAALPPLKNKTIQLKYSNPSNMVAAVQTVFVDRRSKVVPDARTSQLVILGTEEDLLAVDKLVEQIDTPTKQVLIEAKILETAMNPKTSKGVDWSSTLRAQNITFGNGILDPRTSRTITELPGTPTTTTLPGGRTVTTTPDSSSRTFLETILGSGGVSYNTLSGFSPATAFLNADGMRVVLSFLNSSDDTKLISEPRTVTLDNQKATIDVGLLFPIVNTTAGTANTTGGSSISYSNLTVNLDVTPRIAANNFVELKVQQGILRLGPLVPSKVGGVENVVNSFFTRRLETSVLIPSGNTLVMGGLVSDENTSANTKVPLLGDLPGLGLLFRKDSKERNRQNLIIFITPTIVQDSDFQPAHSEYLQSSGKQEEVPEWSAWDSGKAMDWSKPAFPLHPVGSGQP